MTGNKNPLLADYIRIEGEEKVILYFTLGGLHKPVKIFNC